MTLSWRSNRIPSVDPVAHGGRAVRRRNLAISEAAAPHGLYYAPDPSSQIACTIGGNVAENSGGVHCLKYGLTLHNVLRVGLHGGSWRGGRVRLEAPGRRADLMPLVVGSEGMLAVVTEVTVGWCPPQPGALHHGQLRRHAAAGDAVAGSSPPASSRPGWR